MVEGGQSVAGGGGVGARELGPASGPFDWPWLAMVAGAASL